MTIGKHECKQAKNTSLVQADSILNSIWHKGRDK
jgi:hypothetical protein